MFLKLCTKNTSIARDNKDDEKQSRVSSEEDATI